MIDLGIEYNNACIVNAPIKVMPLPGTDRGLGRGQIYGAPRSRGIRLSSIDICGSKVNVIVSMHVQYE